MNRISEAEIAFIYNNQDKSIVEIAEILNRSKSTIYKYMSMYRTKMKTRAERAGAGGRVRSQRYRQASIDFAHKVFEENVYNEFFLIGLALYWAEGSKRSIQFSNTDHVMISFMLAWFERYIDHNGIKIEIRCNNENKQKAFDFWGQYVSLENVSWAAYKFRKEHGMCTIILRSTKKYGHRHFINEILKLYAEHISQHIS